MSDPVFITVTVYLDARLTAEQLAAIRQRVIESLAWTGVRVSVVFETAS